MPKLFSKCSQVDVITAEELGFFCLCIITGEAACFWCFYFFHLVIEERDFVTLLQSPGNKPQKESLVFSKNVIATKIYIFVC